MALTIGEKIKTAKTIGYIRYWISVVGAFLVLSFMAYWALFLIEKPEVTSYREKVEYSEQSVIQLQKAYIDFSLQMIASDLKFMNESIVYTDYINGRQSIDQVLSDMVVLMKERPDYDQLRYIDENGMEIIRLNNNGEVKIVAAEDLQDKSSRYYFVETMKLGVGEVYQSPIDLNIENGVLEIPHKPMIRVGMKVIDELGEVRGILMINYNAGPMIQAIEGISGNSDGNSFLLNGNSHYIAGTEDENFAFALGESEKVIGFDEQYPKAWQIMSEEATSNNVIQTYSCGMLLTGVKIEYGTGDVGDIYWYMVSVLESKATSIETEEDIFRLVLLDYIQVIPIHFMLFLVAWIIVEQIYSRKLQNELMYNLAQYDQLTKTFNRNAGLMVVNENLKYALRNDYDYTICFIDLNDLKIVNDRYGHDAGDQYLQDAVTLIHKAYRKSDIVIRMGGDEFLIGMHSSSAVAEKNWQKVSVLVSDFNESKTRDYRVALSHGVASAQEENIDNLDQLIVLADGRMYDEKRRMKKMGLADEKTD